GGTAAGVGTEDLAEEDPQGDKRGVDPVAPQQLGGRQGTRDDVLRQDVGERQAAVLKELTPEESDLVLKPALLAIPHPCGLLLGDGFVFTYHSTERGLSTYVFTIQGLDANHATFARHADAISHLAPRRPGSTSPPHRLRQWTLASVGP